MRDCVAAEEAEDVGVVLFYAVFAVDEDECATESGVVILNQKDRPVKNKKSQVVGRLKLTVFALGDTS